MSRSNGDVKAGTSLELSVSSGKIYYTTNGSDPRMIDGEIHPRALEFSESLVLEQDLDIRARTWIDGEWSALAEGTFSVKAVL
jgi:hypothetical protein